MEQRDGGSTYYQVDRQQIYAERPGFRINELQLSPTQTVPWHFHNKVQDTFYVIEGELTIFLREPEAELRLGTGECFAVRPRRPHHVTNSGASSATFLILQGHGEFDFIPLALPEADA